MRPKKRITMADVAAGAGVSTAVISYVLNGRSEAMRIPASTQARVLQTCRDLGYRPDYFARAMAGSRTNVIGVLFCNSRGDFMSDILSGIYDVLRENDHQIALSIVEDNAEIEAADLAALRHRRVDGVISFPVWENRVSEHWKEAISSGLPAMFLSLVPFGVKGASIDIDDFQSGCEAARIAAKNGCEEALLYEFGAGPPPLIAREAGFVHEANRLGIPLHRIAITERGDGLMDYLSSASHVTATFVARASELIAPLQKLFGSGTLFDQRHIFTSVGHCPEAHFIPNRWFMLPHPARQMGRLAAMRLLERIGTGNTDFERTVLPHHWTSNRAGKASIMPPRPL